MKHLKLLGLALVAALALTVVAAGGTASATVLCKQTITGEGCTALGQIYGIGTVIDASQEGTSVFENMSNEELFNCTGSTLQGETWNTGSISTAVGAEIKALTLTGCSRTVAIGKLGELEFKHIAGTSNGTVFLKFTKMTVTFGTNVCPYGASTGIHFGTLTDVKGVETKYDVNAVLIRSEPSLVCPAEFRWTATYRVTSPSPLYVSAS